MVKYAIVIDFMVWQRKRIVKPSTPIYLLMIMILISFEGINQILTNNLAEGTLSVGSAKML